MARRDHSAREIQQKLQQRGFDHSTIQMVLQKAQERGWQSDERFAQVWVRTCIARGDGARKIMAQPQQKGLAAALVEQRSEERRVGKECRRRSWPRTRT